MFVKQPKVRKNEPLIGTQVPHEKHANNGGR